MRVEGKGLIDRDRPVSFRFDGREYQGFAGDTLASALLANDVRMVARSFKYHRPRGVMTAGSEVFTHTIQDTLHFGTRCIMYFHHVSP